jgi:arylsulfatase A-like enzyme
MSDRQLEVIHQAYDAEVASADDSVGALVDRLETAGVLDDTVFIAMSDHGENLGDHHMFDHIGSLHRSVLHVPLVIRAPGVFDDGRVIDDTVRLEDVFPTILELCRVKVPPDVEGRSLLNELPGRVAVAAIGPPDVARLQAETLYTDADVDFLRAGCRSAYDGTHHLVAYDDGRTALYDVSQDPLELVDLASKLPGVVERLRPHLLPDAHK